MAANKKKRKCLFLIPNFARGRKVRETRKALPTQSQDCHNEYGRSIYKESYESPYCSNDGAFDLVFFKLTGFYLQFFSIHIFSFSFLFVIYLFVYFYKKIKL
jgi:hypothetical protein